MHFSQFLGIDLSVPCVIRDSLHSLCYFISWNLHCTQSMSATTCIAPNNLTQNWLCIRDCEWGPRLRHKHVHSFSNYLNIMGPCYKCYTCYKYQSSTLGVHVSHNNSFRATKMHFFLSTQSLLSCKSMNALPIFTVCNMYLTCNLAYIARDRSSFCSGGLQLKRMFIE